MLVTLVCSCWVYISGLSCIQGQQGQISSHQVQYQIEASFLNIFVRNGAISWCSSLRSLGEISSGPEAFLGFRFFKRFFMPLIVIEISGI